MTARMLTWTLWLAAPTLVLVRTFWCQLHGSAGGGALVGFDVAVPWALQAASGWILAAALLTRFGGRLLASDFATRRPRAVRVLLGAGIVTITCGSETWLLAGDTRLTLWLYERLPLHVPFAALLLWAYRRCAYLLPRARSGAPAPDETREPPRMIDVMTGTGSTQVCIDDIECLEAERNYVNVHTSQRSYLLRQTLTAAADAHVAGEVVAAGCVPARASLDDREPRADSGAASGWRAGAAVGTHRARVARIRRA